MLVRVRSATVLGVSAIPVDVEVDASQGMPHTRVVGLPGTGVQESRVRVAAAIKNLGVKLPSKRITINLAPADLRKAGPSYDLPIAIGVLAASQQLKVDDLNNALIVGELGLDGAVRHIRGVISVAALARERQSRCPLEPVLGSFPY